jgi:outer membrane autotransporter protein
MHENSQTGAFSIKGDGWMAGPYATARLSQNVFLQGRAAWGRSSNSVSPFHTYTDDFKTERWLVSSALIGRWKWGPWQFQPSATLSYIQDISGSYTDSLGVVIPSVKVSLGQFKAGPEGSYRYELANGTILEPRVGLQVIWNFDSSDNSAAFGGTLAGPEEVRGRVELGVTTRLTNGIGIDISGSYDGIGSNSFHSTGGRVTVRAPLN